MNDGHDETLYKQCKQNAANSIKHVSIRRNWTAMVRFDEN
jgi:hypothetical protein